MKYIYYSSLLFALLFGSCSQQKRIAKTPDRNPNTVASNLATNETQPTVVYKVDTTSIDPKEYYEDAYSHLQQMLTGQRPLDFKKAIFITENAWCRDKLNYDLYNNYITYLANECKAWKKTNKLRDYVWEKDSTQVALNGAIYHVLTDTIRDEKGKIISIPYHYDFNDCFAKDKWTNMFVTKLMATHGGNCHSLPFLYKILSEELGTKTYLCFLPGHIYLNQYSQKTSWYNTELTGRCFPVDAWLMTTGYVSVQSIRTGLYMDTLSLKQSIVVCVNDLAKGYARKFGDGDYKFILKCCDLGLKYYPTYGELLLLKAETLKKLYQSQIAKYGLNAPDSKEYGDTIHAVYNKMEQTYNTLAKLDYREIPEALYSHWTEAMLNGGKAETENIHDTVVTTNVISPFGKKIDMIAVSNGEYVELFENDTLRRIGSVMFNNITHKVEYFILEDDEKYSAELERPKEPARFMSVDPMTKKFPELTPYQFASDRPIQATDLDGMEANNATGGTSDQSASTVQQPVNPASSTYTAPPPGVQNIKPAIHPGLSSGKVIGADVANAPYTIKPYSENSTVSEGPMKPTDPNDPYVRFSNSNDPQSSPEGTWFARYNDVKNMSPEQIQQTYALPKVPNQMTAVNPSNMTVRAGIAGANQYAPTGGGGLQYESMQGKVPTAGTVIQLTNNVKVSQAVKMVENPGLPVEPFAEATIVDPEGVKIDDINDFDFFDFFSW